MKTKNGYFHESKEGWLEHKRLRPAALARGGEWIFAASRKHRWDLGTSFYWELMVPGLAEGSSPVPSRLRKTIPSELPGAPAGNLWSDAGRGKRAPRSSDTRCLARGLSRVLALGRKVVPERIWAASPTHHSLSHPAFCFFSTGEKM